MKTVAYLRVSTGSQDLQRFTLGLLTSEEKGDWFTALNHASDSREKPRGPGACPLFPCVTPA